jgi:plasmid stabilization system protein ParE
MQVRWTEQAVQNLEDIKSFIRKDSPAYAIAVVSRLYEAVSQLEVFPDSGRVVPERGEPTIRELVRPPYRIVYRRFPPTSLRFWLCFAHHFHFRKSAE